jgi:hypothetical protein
MGCELGSIMPKYAIAMLALLCVPQTALAQDLKAKPTHLAASAHGETLDDSAARIAVKAALQPQAQPTQQELLNVILLMSLRGQRPSRT